MPASPPDPRKAIAAVSAGTPPTGRSRPRRLGSAQAQGEVPLLPRVATGEEGAVAACLDRYGGLIWTIARKMLGAGMEAEDAVQDVFIELWRSAARFDPSKGSEVTFVSTITRRRVIDRVRKRTTRPEAAHLDENFDSAAEPESDSAELAEEFERAQVELAKLPPQRQNVLRLALLSGATHAEISEQTGLPLGTVKTHIRRGLLHLRDVLQRKQAPSERAS